MLDQDGNGFIDYTDLVILRQKQRQEMGSFKVKNPDDKRGLAKLRVAQSAVRFSLLTNAPQKDLGSERIDEELEEEGACEDGAQCCR